MHICSNELRVYGVAVGVKEVMYKGKQECRPSMVVLVNDIEGAKASIQAELVSNVIKVINQSSGKAEQFRVEENPFWLKFIFHKPEFYSRSVPC